ncbi:MAG: hypothetical protein A2902_01145 [Elusimicrobia bacterium RIFCSPLOWO2_01_FULL_64_13]|nr:MAG: hypothetical protein A2902_01145 [Elusimicrobia bacterium RIFCSPLOWO2_01_FULL_64_13]
METRNVEALRTRLKAFVASRLGPSALPPAIAIDLEVSRDAVTDSFLEEVRRLEPFGQGNPAPVLCLRGAIVKEISLMGPDRNHLKLVLEISGRNVKAVGWGMSGLKDAAGPGGTLDLAFELEFESRGKSQSPRFNLLDLCPAGPEELDLGWVGAARGNKT